MLNKKKIFFIPLLSVFFLFTVNSIVCFAQEGSAAEKQQSVRVAVIDYPNYIQMTSDGSVSGYAYEYLLEIQKYTNWNYDFIEMSFTDASNALENGTIDLVAGNQYTAARAERWDYSARDMGEGGTVLCVRPDDMRYSYNDFSSYQDLKIAALSGSIRIEQTIEKLSQYHVEANFIEYDTDEECKEALQSGTVDAILMSTIRCDSDYKILARINSTLLYFCTSKQRPELKAQLDAAMEEIHLDSPYYDMLLDKKYYGDIPVQLAFTKEERDYIASTDTIYVAVSDDYAPVEYYNKKNKCYQGFIPDYFLLLSQYSGLKFEYISRPAQTDLQNMLTDGSIQLIGSIANLTENTDPYPITLSSPLFQYTVNNLQTDFCIGISSLSDPLLLSILNKSIASITIEQKTNILVQNLSKASEHVSFRSFLAANRFTIIMIALIIFIVITFFVICVAVLLKRSNRNLQNALQRADSANRIKSDFMSRMSHDMRTPMNGILGLTYLMEKQTNLTDTKRYLPQLRKSGEYLLQLVNDVLDINRIESGTIELHPKICNEEILFTSIIDMLKSQIDQKSIDFCFEEKDIQWEYVLLDEQRVKQIFVNLISNSVKFTPAGGRIDFKMKRLHSDEHLVQNKYIIRDTGIGISEEFLPKLFDPFAQENRVDKDLQTGTGLGLAIVKQLIDLMEGKVEVRSQVDAGTEFTVYLNFPVVQNSEVEAEKAQPAIPQFPANTHILLCEDHPLNAQIAIHLLEKQNAVVTWSENGQLGVAEFLNSTPDYYDAILMDIRMPIMNGLQAAHAIRALNRTDAKTIPIIAMTANAFDEDIKASLAAGMNAHLAKPVDPEKMFQILEKLISDTKH